MKDLDYSTALLKYLSGTSFLPSFILILTTLSAVAQKLPNKQDVSLRAPNNIKIDGKAAEWNDKYQAYNIGSRLYYTLSNDDEKLYLVAKIEDRNGNRKVLYGGITLELISSAKKAEKISIRYHALIPSVDLENMMLSPGRYAQYAQESPQNTRKMDSVIVSANNWITSNFNTVQIQGIPEIQDPIISVYNEEGILVAGKMNDKMQYTYELAIPMRYIKQFFTADGKIKYNIRVNARPVKKPGSFDPPVVNGGQQINFETMYLTNDTEVSGKYMLAKK